MSLDLLSIILLFGAAQGFTLATLLLFKHRQLRANYFLSLLMLAYSIILIELFLQDAGFYQQHPDVLVLLSGFPLAAGPLHYLYARHLMHPGRMFRALEWLHFLPLLAYKAVLMLALFLPGAGIAVPPGLESRVIPFPFIFLNWAINLQVLLYMALTAFFLHRHAARLEQYFSSLSRLRLDWLRNITYLTALTAIIFLIENICFVLGIELQPLFAISSVLAGILVYAMGYLGLAKSEIFREPHVASSLHQLTDLDAAPVAAKKYEKSGLSDDKAAELAQRLLHLMAEDKLYTDSELTLHSLAERLSISPHNLSEIINTRLGQSFFDFVNGYRIEQVKRDLADARKSHLKLLAVAFDAGFNSKTSFNTIFKKHTGLTPSDYRRWVQAGTRDRLALE